MKKNRVRREAMEARSVDAIPSGNEWQYEPKWDGFRCLLTRDSGAVSMYSKSGQDLARYFPEVVAAALTMREKSFVLDGEIVVPVGGRLSFDDLLQRIHPTASRVMKLAEQTPALFLAFDLLKKGKTELAALPLSKRRPKLEDFATLCFSSKNPFRLSPASLSLEDAERWLTSAGGGSDGVIAKRIDLPYQAGNREGMQKIKRYRSADCVIGGFRYGENLQAGRKVVGSVLLGLYDADGLLHHVGFSSAIKAKDKPSLTDKLEAIKNDRSFAGNAPGGPSRWSTKRSSEWQPVSPKHVVEVSYDHFTGGRFRHGTSILRWRPDKKPRQCTFEQVNEKIDRRLMAAITSPNLTTLLSASLGSPELDQDLGLHEAVFSLISIRDERSAAVRVPVFGPYWIRLRIKGRTKWPRRRRSENIRKGLRRKSSGR